MNKYFIEPLKRREIINPAIFKFVCLFRERRERVKWNASKKNVIAIASDEGLI
ncbi:MAG TPA: hypothetical protein VF487_03920 [Chitinophagaceae bacterium]